MHALGCYGAPFLFSVPAVPAIVLERKLFTRERNDGCYLTITYLLFKFIEEAFVAAIAAAVFLCTVFWSIQYQGTPGLFYLAFYMTLLCGIVVRCGRNIAAPPFSRLVLLGGSAWRSALDTPLRHCPWERASSGTPRRNPAPCVPVWLRPLFPLVWPPWPSLRPFFCHASLALFPTT